MSDLLYHSVMHCCPTKIFFGEISTEDLDILVREVMIGEYDPRKIKDEIRALELDPIETTRDVITEGESTSQNLTRTQGESQGQTHTQTQGQEQSEGRSLGISRQIGITETMGEAQTFTSGHVTTRGRASSSGDGSGVNHVSGAAESILPDGNGGFVIGGDVIHTSSESTSRSSNNFNSTTDSSSEGDIETVGRAYNWTRGKQNSLGQSATSSQTRGRSRSQSKGAQKGQSQSVAVGLTAGKNKSKSVTPFYEYRKTRPVSSRQFLSEPEQMTIALQKIKGQPKGHFLLKVPGHKALFLRAPFVKTPWISERQRNKALERIFAQPHYATVEQIETEEQERTQRVRALLPKPAPPPKMTTAPLAPAKQTKKLTSANKNLTLWDHLADSTEPNTKKSK